MTKADRLTTPPDRPAARQPRRQPMRRGVVIAVAGVVAALGFLSAWTLASTGYETRPERPLVTPGARDTPAWSRPCWRPNPAPYSACTPWRARA